MDGVRRGRRLRRAGVVAVAVSAGVLAAAGAAEAQSATPASVRVTPGLQPNFDPAQTDYVTRCTGTPLNVRVYAPGQAVTVDGTAKRQGLSYSTVALEQNQAFQFQIGSKTYSVRCLPTDFPKFTIRKTGTTENGYALLTPGNYAAMFDGSGTPVWWTRAAEGHGNIDFKRLPDGTFAYYDITPQFFVGFGTMAADGWKIIDLNNQLKREIRFQGSPTDLHELQQRANGNYYVQSYVQRDDVDLSQFDITYTKSVVDAGIQEVTPDNKTVWSWNSKDHLDLAEAGRWGSPLRVRPLPNRKLALDLRHINAIQELPDGNLLLSMRHTDSVYKISRTTGEVIWKLGGTKTSKSLDITNVADDTSVMGGQHDVRVLPNGHVTVFDNATGQSRPPEAQEYSIDEATGTAKLLTQIKDPEAKISNLVGSARHLSGGHWLVNWGGTGLWSETDASGTPVLRVQFARGITPYRAEPIAKSDLSITTVRAGMNAQYPRG